MTKQLPEAQALADEFVKVLRSWANDAEWQTMLDTNARGGPNTNAEHDFCDANMAMDAAFRKLGVNPLPRSGGMSQQVTDLWNAAWELAKPQLTNQKLATQLAMRDKLRDQISNTGDC